MFCESKISKALIYEPRILFRLAARHHLEALGFHVADIPSDGLVETVCALQEPPALIAIGIAGAGKELYSVLRGIHRLTALNANVVIWLPEDDMLLQTLMQGLGVKTLLNEPHIDEQLPRYLLNPVFGSGYLHQWPRHKAQRGKDRLSEAELNTLIDSSRGLNSHEIGRLRHTSYKTVFTHKRNTCLRLRLNNSTQWLDLLTRLARLSSY